MAAAFRFSTGDFIAAIGLVRDVTKALCDSNGSSREYMELIHELHTLETALPEVRILDVELEQHAQRAALRYAIGQCQQTIDDFLGSLSKYHPCLRTAGSSSLWKDALRRIQWQFCKKEDWVRFRIEVGFHAQAI